MADTSPQGEYAQLAQIFRELRSWVDERLLAKGLRPGSLDQTRRPVGGITLADLEQLKADVGALIQAEGRRSFWSGLVINAIFFVLGLVTGVAADVLKASARWLF